MFYKYYGRWLGRGLSSGQSQLFPVCRQQGGLAATQPAESNNIQMGFTLNSVSDNSEKVICFPLNLFILTELSDQAWPLLFKNV